MNKEWLICNSSVPIKYNLTRSEDLIDDLFENYEVLSWFGRLCDRVSDRDLGNIHGSHDYRYENIIGKCFILGLNASIPRFDKRIKFFINFLENHINQSGDKTLTFGLMYQYLDYETILACYLPFLGYHSEDCILYITHKRINILYNFTRLGKYDIYRSDLSYPGVKREWKPYIVDPVLYEDGNIALPSIHDLILFAGMYSFLDEDSKDRIETIVNWIFGGDYGKIHGNLYYYVPLDPSYKAKSINSKVILPVLDCGKTDKGELPRLIFLCFILSHFKSALRSEWFLSAVKYLSQYKTITGRYIFPSNLIMEQTDSYVTSGRHMNVGEFKNCKNYFEIISTYWMEKIAVNCRESKEIDI